MALAVPAANDDSLILDFATSAVAGGRLKQLRDSGATVPPGSLIDQMGNPTIDPGVLAAGGMLLTFGGHKGYGLSLLVSLLAGCVVGQAAEGTFLPGVLAIAINPGAFADRTAVLESVERQLAKMRETEPGPGFDRVEVPGDFERHRRKASAGMLNLPDATWASLVSLGESLGMAGTEFQDALPAEDQM
jgi:LDH2 family malate/lactate/ureidoglycolate dehydrogenase